MPEPRYVELDLNVEPCPRGTITANPWGLCTRCTDAESDDESFNRPLRVADPFGSKS